MVGRVRVLSRQSYARWVSTVAGPVRVTVTAPSRRLDVALPGQVPVADLLPELVRHAGERASRAAGGWSLRRTDGAALSPARDLRAQGVRDGELLCLVPSGLDWPAPAYDEVAEAVADAARGRGARWSGSATGAVSTVVAGLLLAGGLALLVTGARAAGPVPSGVVAGGLLAAAMTGPRRDRQRRTGAVLAGAALAYAAVAGGLWAPGGHPLPGGAVALALASGAGLAAMARGHGGGAEQGARTREVVFTAGAVTGLIGAGAALVAVAWGVTGAAAVLACGLVCGASGLPLVAVWLAGLPAPPPAGAIERDAVFAAVARADVLLTGSLWGWVVLAAAGTGALLATGGTAGRVLAAVTATALVLRARQVTALRHRLPLLAGGLAGHGALAGVLAAAVTAGPAPWSAGPALLLAGTAVVAALLLATARADRDRAWPVWVSRAAEVADTGCVVIVVPVAAAVLDLYAAAHALLPSI